MLLLNKTLSHRLLSLGGLCALALLVAAATPSSARAQAAPAAPATLTLDQTVDGLQKKYETVTDFKADFKQVVQQKHIPRPLKKRGTVYFKKPGMMRWDYKQPDKVLYVSDGETLWSYQPADKLVYKLRVKDSELYSALKFLFGQGNLRAEFVLSSLEPRDGNLGIRLDPKGPQTHYKHLELYVDPTTFEIRETVLVDPLDNVSRISFEAPVYDPLKEAGFKFTPPSGVRVEDLQAQGAAPGAP